MGGMESRFNALLVEGKAEEALRLWHENADLQSSYRLNVPVKSTSDRDTPLNLATRAEMTAVVKELLARGANPLCPNAKGMTALHTACVSARCGSRTGQRRADILQLLLDKVVETYDKGSYVAFPDPRTGTGSKRSFLNEWWWGSQSGEGSSREQANEQEEFNLGIQDKVTFAKYDCLWVM